MSFLWGKIRDNDDNPSCSSDEDDEGMNNDRMSGDHQADDALFHAPSSLVVVASNHSVSPNTIPVALPPQQHSHTMTWEEAHRLACLQNGSLKATRLQIESQFPIGQEIPVPEDDSLLLMVWNEHSIVEQLVTLMKQPDRLKQQRQPSESSSSASSFLWNAIRGIWAFTQVNRSKNADDEDEESDTYEEQEDTTTMDLQLGLVHPTLARSVLGYLTSIINMNPNEIVPFSSPSLWNKWVMQQEKAADQLALSSFPVDELKVLFQVLERSGVPVSVQTTRSNELVLVTGMLSDDKNDVSTRLVEYDLQQTALRLEQEHLALEEQSKKHRKAALAAKQRKGNPIPSMKLYKLCEAQMAHKQNHLLQIETVRMALRQAVNNRSVVQAMGSARTMLRDIHKELENVHDVMDDLKEVMQDHEEVNAALQSSVLVETDDEDELLQELQNLCLDAEDGDEPNGIENTNVSVAPDTTIESTNAATNEIEAVDATSVSASSPVPVSL